MKQLADDTLKLRVYCYLSVCFARFIISFPFIIKPRYLYNSLYRFFDSLVTCILALEIQIKGQNAYHLNIC